MAVSVDSRGGMLNQSPKRFEMGAGAPNLEFTLIADGGPALRFRVVRECVRFVAENGRIERYARSGERLAGGGSTRWGETSRYCWPTAPITRHGP
jgi:hypothetical protein